MSLDHRRKWFITFTVMSGTIMGAIDSSIVNVALPHMRGTLGASLEEITWVATGYILSSVIVMPIIGLLVARFGRKNLYYFCILLFTVSSLMCGLAWDLTSMVVFRIIQGFGGGALIPVAQAILRETWPPDQQGMAMGIYGLGVVMGPAFGPTLGGWLTDHYSWPWIFYINVPVGIVTLMLVPRYIEDPPYLIREKGRIDVPGLVFLVLFLGALQIMLEKGEHKNWFESSYITSLALIAACGFLLFLWRELTTAKPAVDLGVLKNIPFASGTFLNGILGLGLFGGLFLLPLFLQQLLNFPALDAALPLMPRSLAMGVTLLVAGRLYNRLGPRLIVGTRLLIPSLSFRLLSELNLYVGMWDIFMPQFLQGIGFGLVFVALTTASLSTLEKTKIQAATGVYNVVRQVFGSVAIAMAANLLSRGTTAHKVILTEHITRFNYMTGKWVNALSGLAFSKGSDSSVAFVKALKIVDAEALRQAAMIAFNREFIIVHYLFIFMIPLVFFLRGTGSPAPMRVEVE
ncbi:MAG: DHA2 family efflux MFS transporter permease subunit [Deltaproteobacteria bacterium]|nr:DHA2 family efflux MFS transporter permease subunit [Deltaproteobacteria bacterium]